MDKWEYGYAYVANRNLAITIEILNEYGRTGWEHTGYVTDTGVGKIYLMKRRIVG